MKYSGNRDSLLLRAPAIGPHEDLLTIVKRRKLQWYGHVSRSSSVAKTILQGTVKGERRQDRRRKRLEDNIREWTGLEFGKSQRAVENREKWRKLVAESSVVPQRPSRLRDWWWWWWWWAARRLPLTATWHDPSAVTHFPEHEHRSVILKSKPATCLADPIPTSMFLDCLDDLLPTMTQIVNDSLLSGSFPSVFEHAFVKPLLKMPTFDHSNIENYRPVSNLSFLSEVTEKKRSFTAALCLLELPWSALPFPVCLPSMSQFWDGPTQNH